MPRFAEPIANVTVSIGRDALLACVVENLKGYKVAWVRVDTQTILSIHHNVISQNNRISLTYNDHRSVSYMDSSSRSRLRYLLFNSSSGICTSRRWRKQIVAGICVRLIR